VQSPLHIFLSYADQSVQHVRLYRFDIFGGRYKIYRAELHPFMPFITEEVYQKLNERDQNDFIMISKFPNAKTYGDNILKEGKKIKEIISAIRDIREQVLLLKPVNVLCYCKSSIGSIPHRNTMAPPKLP
jgi:valyl-tRNA synthetase